MRHMMQETLRYLNYTEGRLPDERTEQHIHDCMTLLEETASFQSVSVKAPLAIDGTTLRFLDMTIQSTALAGHVAGCASLLLLACTLGAGVDRLMQRLQLVEISKAYILQACAAAMLEEECDALQSLIAKQEEPSGLYIRPRFSPGYGDLPLSLQPALLSILQAHKRIGLTCTTSNMLTPTKSITAIIGLSPIEGCVVSHGCDVCNLKTCAFRRKN